MAAKTTKNRVISLTERTRLTMRGRKVSIVSAGAPLSIIELNFKTKESAAEFFHDSRPVRIQIKREPNKNGRR